MAAKRPENGLLSRADFTKALHRFTVYHASANKPFRKRTSPYFTVTGRDWLAKGKTTQSGVRTMKMIISALVALSVLTGVAASANAFDAKNFYEQQDRSSY